MPTPEGLLSLEEALGKAAVEVGLEDEAGSGAEQPAGKAPDQEAQEQTQQEAGQPEEQSDEPLFDELLKAEPEEEQRTGIDWDATVELPGENEPVSLSEMRDGYLRQADYTRKTQALAAERRQFEEEHDQAVKLHRALIEDPPGTAAFLAVQTGVVKEQDVADKVRDLQGVWQKPPSREEIEAELEQRVAKAVEDHPAVVEARRQAMLASIEQDFARIEQKHSIRLTVKDRQAILRKAVESGTSDLELVTESMLRRLDRIRQEREQAREAASPRPGVRGPSSDTPAKVESIEDAFALAEAEMAKGG